MTATASERKTLRRTKLKELYDFHFENRGNPTDVGQDVKSNGEVYLAYKYLEGKRYIVLDERNNGLFVDASITSYGIDVIENDLEL